jgi:hypothetical protein
MASAWGKGRRLRSQLCGTGDAQYLDDLLGFLDDNEVGCLLSYWGIGVLGDLRAVRRHRPDVKIILNVLCHPTALSRSKVAAQNWFFRHSVDCCDGLIVSSRAMEQYLHAAVLRGRTTPTLVWPPYLSEQYQPRTRLPECAHAPNVLFLGRMDWRGAQPSDNVVGLLRGLMDCGVHVYHHDAPESPPTHLRQHVFRYLSLSEATVYATQFDASLIVYNRAAGARADRFEVTVPDRLVAGVAAGVPIAIPSSGYAACREYLKDYRAVIAFTSPEDLANQLKDRKRVAEMKRMAEEDAARYAAERHVEPLARFVRRVTGPAREQDPSPLAACEA